MKYRAGQLVTNNKLGLGKVLEVRGDNLTVFFKDQKDNPRIINVAVAPMALAKVQSDPGFDDPNLIKKCKRTLSSRKKAAKRQIVRSS